MGNNLFSMGFFKNHNDSLVKETEIEKNLQEVVDLLQKAVSQDSPTGNIVLNKKQETFLIIYATTAMKLINSLEKINPKLHMHYENQGLFLGAMIDAIDPENRQPSQVVKTAGYNYVVSKDPTGTITLSNIEQNKAPIIDGITSALGQDTRKDPTLGG